jgi:hypothetical protein
MTDVSTTIDSWFAALNEPEAARRAAHVEQAWAGDGRWVDPPFEGQGHAEISQMVDGVYAQYPGARFRRVTSLDAHHDAVRYGWELVDPQGDVIVAGTDIGQLAPDGRLQRVSGFFGALGAEQAA